MPERCPLCEAAVVKPEGRSCTAAPTGPASRGSETLNNWVMAAMDIEGVGEQFAAALNEGISARCPTSTG